MSVAGCTVNDLLIHKNPNICYLSLIKCSWSEEETVSCVCYEWLPVLQCWCVMFAFFYSSASKWTTALEKRNSRRLYKNQQNISSLFWCPECNNTVCSADLKKVMSWGRRNVLVILFRMTCNQVEKQTGRSRGQVARTTSTKLYLNC